MNRSLLLLGIALGLLFRITLNIVGTLVIGCVRLFR